MQVATSYAEAQATLKSLTELMLLFIPCALAIAGIAGLVLTNRVLCPVRQIITAADTIHHEDLSKRLPVIGGDEFSLLATTINSMLDAPGRGIFAITALHRKGTAIYRGCLP